MEKVESKKVDKDSLRSNLSFYVLGVLLLAVMLIVGSGVKDGLIALIAYVPLYVFLRYLQRHGGMGWRWPD